MPFIFFSNVLDSSFSLKLLHDCKYAVKRKVFDYLALAESGIDLPLLVVVEKAHSSSFSTAARFIIPLFISSTKTRVDTIKYKATLIVDIGRGRIISATDNHVDTYHNPYSLQALLNRV